MILDTDVTKIFDKNEIELRKGTRIIINEGGTGSSKTYSLAQLFIGMMLAKTGVTMSIVRKTMPALRATAMRDFFNILKELGIYRPQFHNKSDNIYTFRGNTVEFFGVDQPLKVRSRRRHYLWLNEANEFTLEDYRQLAMRTSKQIFLDYNPSYFDHWIYDELQTKKDCVIIHSSYKDNLFLQKEIIKEIESYKSLDENYWRIYGLGLKGIAQSLIYSHWQLCDDLPENPDETIYGLDFGYNNPATLTEIAIKDKKYYWKERIYESFLTTPDLIERMKDQKISKTAYIYGDSEDPKAIEEISLAGFNILPSFKGKGSVKTGIGFIKSHVFYITKDSLNIQKEAKAYSWKVKNGKPIDEPVKAKDHAMDGGRYAVYTHSLGAVGELEEDETEEKDKPITAGLLEERF